MILSLFILLVEEKVEMFCVGGTNEVLCIKVGGIHTYHHIIVIGIRLEGLTKK